MENKIRTRKDITMKRKITASLLVAVILIFSTETRLISYAADSSVTINTTAPLITEMTKVWARFSGMEDEWREIFPDLDSREVRLNSTQEYLLDYDVMLRYMESVFTEKLASDMLHRKNSGLFCHNGHYYFHGGWVTMQFRPVFYEMDEPHRELSAAIPQKNITVLTADDNKITANVRYYLHTGYTTDTPRKEYNETVEFTKTVAGWRISGGSMIDSLFAAFPVYSYDTDNPLTGSGTVYAVMITAIAAACFLTVYSKKHSALMEEI